MPLQNLSTPPKKTFPLSTEDDLISASSKNDVDDKPLTPVLGRRTYSAPLSSSHDVNSAQVSLILAKNCGLFKEVEPNSRDSLLYKCYLQVLVGDFP